MRPLLLALPLLALLACSSFSARVQGGAALPARGIGLHIPGGAQLGVGLQGGVNLEGRRHWLVAELSSRQPPSEIGQGRFPIGPGTFLGLGLGYEHRLAPEAALTPIFGGSLLVTNGSLCTGDVCMLPFSLGLQGHLGVRAALNEKRTLAFEATVRPRIASSIGVEAALGLSADF